jgi:hypothetical protein
LRDETQPAAIEKSIDIAGWVAQRQPLT